MSKNKFLLFLTLIVATLILCTKVDFDGIVADLDDSKIDKIAPVIILGVDDTDYVEINSITSYAVIAEAWDSTSDSTADDLTTSIKYVNTVDPTVADTYAIYLSVSDTSGNYGYDTLIVIVTDSVPVKDTDPPVVTLLGDATIEHQVNTFFEDPGATAYDSVDGDVPVQNNMAQYLDTTSVGTYIISYWAIDKAGNRSEDVTRIIFVKDNVNNKPEITIHGANPLELELGETYIQPNVTAYDKEDDSLNNSIVVGGDSVNTNSEGTYNVTFSVTDSDENTVTKTLVVIVTDGSQVDTEAPVITISGPDPLTIDSGATYNHPEASAVDNVDGNIDDSKFTKTGDVNTAIVDTYEVVYTVSDVAGNEAKDTLTVIVQPVGTPDIIAPVITISGPDPLVIDSGSTYNHPEATAVDNIDGNIDDSKFTKTGDVNTAIVDTYEVVYTVSDVAGNEAKDTLTVIVKSIGSVDTEAPVITISGPDPLVIDSGSTYNHPEATAVDNIDGNIDDSKFTKTGDVNTAIVDTYEVVYTVSDVAGNEAKDTLTVIVKSVVVVDTEAPVITISGPNPLTIDSGATYNHPEATAVDNVDGNINDSQFTKTGSVNTTVVDTYEVVYTVSDVAGNEASDTLTVIVKSKTGDPCEGVADWSGTEPWTNYTKGDQRVHNNKLWELNGDPAQGAHEPGGSTSEQLNIWTFVDDCNP